MRKMRLKRSMLNSYNNFWLSRWEKGIVLSSPRKSERLLRMTSLSLTRDTTISSNGVSRSREISQNH
jgi:hypothetical protein